MRGIDIDAVHAPKRRWGKSDPSTMGGRIQKARIDNGMSQQELGDACGITRAGMMRIESQKNDLAVRRMVKVARALDVSLHYLCGLTAEYGTFPEEEA